MLQDGNVYLHQLGHVSADWEGFYTPMLGTNDFAILDGSGSTRPDFSALGGVIQFGLYVYSANQYPTGDVQQLASGFDNLYVGMYVVPEPASLLGDLDGDGFVGQYDLDIVLGAWGTNPPSDPRADPSPDGFVGQDDLDTVLGDWGQGTPPAPSVPEPATCALLALGGLVLMRRKQRRHA